MQVFYTTYGTEWRRLYDAGDAVFEEQAREDRYRAAGEEEMKENIEEEERKEKEEEDAGRDEVGDDDYKWTSVPLSDSEGDDIEDSVEALWEGDRERYLMYDSGSDSEEDSF